MFVASPVVVDQSELIKLSKRLKKEKVNVDIISFGEEERNAPILNELVNTINGKEGTGSHLVSIAAPASLSDALFSTPIFQGEDGNMPAGFGPGFQYGMEDDPELAMVLYKLINNYDFIRFIFNFKRHCVFQWKKVDLNKKQMPKKQLVIKWKQMLIQVCFLLLII